MILKNVPERIAMLRGKQRSALKALANPLRATVIVGKQGLTETVFRQIDEQLAANELVKITVLDTADRTAKELAQELCEKAGAEFVSQLGSKLVLYRAADPPVIVLEK